MKTCRINRAVIVLASAAMVGCSISAETPTTPPTPNNLLAIIAKEQVRVTGKSTGFDAYNCYTEVQRQQWEASRGSLRVADRVKSNPRFQAVVTQIAAMEPSAREALLTKAAQSRRPTYAEAVPPGPDRDGHSTTNAGAYVESVVARTIVDVVRSTLLAEEKPEKPNAR